MGQTIQPNTSVFVSLGMFDNIYNLMAIYDQVLWLGYGFTFMTFFFLNVFYYLLKDCLCFLFTGTSRKRVYTCKNILSVLLSF